MTKEAAKKTASDPPIAPASIELRDWFAGLAMHALLMTARKPGEVSPLHAYDIADDMLRTRATDDLPDEDASSG